MNKTSRILVTYLKIFIGFVVAVVFFSMLGGVGTVELGLFSAIAIFAAVYCTWKIRKTESPV